ncbi:MAG: argininosuccinate lyase [candidate division KSB1 bacterium]|nr:argininosuccinate lyase [candidate division KSB1 bacterium]
MAEQKIWAGRFAEATDPLMEAFGNSLAFDQRLFDADIAVNKAWARALVGVGVYTAAEAEQVCAAFDAIHKDFHAGILTFPLGAEDIHSANEKWLTERLGELGGRIHTGRSRNDQVITDLKIYLRGQSRELQASLRRLQQALLERAEEHIETIFPGQTHLQQAQPVSFAHYLLSFFFQMQRNSERLVEWRKRMNTLPLGSGAVAGSAFPVDRGKLAEELGFDRPSENSIDATSDRDFVLEFEYLCAQIMVHLSRLAEDLIIWSCEAFRYVRVAEAYATGSSMMPQKRNPDSLELIRGKTARVIGNLMQGMTLLKGAPTAYVRDLQEDKPAVFDSLDQTTTCLELAARVIRTLEIDKQVMLRAIDAALYATDVADYLVRKGLPFREAHAVVGRLVREAETRSCPLNSLPLELYQALSPLFEEDIFDLFDPAASVNRRNLPGGTGFDAVRKQLETAKSLLLSESGLEEVLVQ